MKNSEILLHPHDYKNKKDWNRILNFLDKNLNFNEISNSLELGAGMGNISFYILKKNPTSEAVCEDINRQFLKIINKKNPKIKTICHDINQNVPFENKTFDVVSCIGILHYSYVENIEKVLKEIIRISKKYILIDFFSAISPWVLLEKIFHPSYNPRRFRPYQINRIFKNYNLKVIAKTSLRTPFPKLFLFLGKTILFLLQNENFNRHRSFPTRYWRPGHLC